MTITEFLEARIAEDEAMANRSVQFGSKGAALLSLGSKDAPPVLVLHPVRILAECAAKRAIIDAHPVTTNVVEVSTRIKPGFACETCFSHDAWVEDSGYCDTLCALAAVYADHPDYQQEWSA